MAQEQLELFAGEAHARLGVREPRRPSIRRATRRSEAATPLPPTLDVLEAARLLGIGRTVAYRLIRQGQWPTHIVHVGRKIKVPTVPLLEFLGVPVRVSDGHVSTGLAVAATPPVALAGDSSRVTARKA